MLLFLEEKLAETNPKWYEGAEALTEEVVSSAPVRFEKAFDRWRRLLSAAERSVELANKALEDYSISTAERKAAQHRRKIGDQQRDTLLQGSSRQNSDFYLYRYLATEGFLPGYNFPRLPLTAFVPGSMGPGTQHFIHRSRFLAISEFGPHGLIYHEGRAFRVTRALLGPSGNDDRRLTTESRALCRRCGAGHEGEPPERCHVCNSPLIEPAIVQRLYRIENLGTDPALRITINDEYRRRQAFEITTTFSFGASSFVSQIALREGDESIAELDFAQAAAISRLNLGLRRRKERMKIGFLIDPSSGAWKGMASDAKANDQPQPGRSAATSCPNGGGSQECAADPVLPIHGS